MSTTTPRRGSAQRSPASPKTTSLKVDCPEVESPKVDCPQAAPIEPTIEAREEAFIAEQIAPVSPPLAAPEPDLEALVRQYLACHPQILAEAVAEATPPPADDPAPVEEEPFLPVPYTNPRVIDEQFYVIGSPYRKRFVRGRFVAASAEEEVSVRSCLESHGRGMADRWRGEDRSEWTDRKTGFRTTNEAAKYDFELIHED